jgi:hypothetical protein
MARFCTCPVPAEVDEDEVLDDVGLDDWWLEK